MEDDVRSRKQGIIEALEAYTANHSEKVEDILRWPSGRFEVFYESFTRRKIVEDLTLQKLAHINAIHSNPNYDQKDAHKTQVIQEMEDRFQSAIDSLFQDTTDVEKRMKEDPFFLAGKRGMEWIDAYETGRALPERKEHGEQPDIDQT